MTPMTPMAEPLAFKPRFATVGESFERSLVLDASSIARFAASAGDFNPLHHDAAAAARTRFGGIIASGPHTSALLMGFSAELFCQRGAALGLEFNFKFRQAVHAGEPLRLCWTVTDVQPTHAGASVRGELVSISGSITNGHNALLLSATGLVLITDSL